MTDRTHTLLRCTLAATATAALLAFAACSSSPRYTTSGPPAARTSAGEPAARSQSGGNYADARVLPPARGDAGFAGPAPNDRTRWVDTDGDGFADARWTELNTGSPRAGAARAPLRPDALPVPDESGPAELVLQPGQELWVIERAPAAGRHAPRAADDDPGSGALMARTCEGDEPACVRPIPLQHTGVEARLAGPISSVKVTQRFVNPFSTKIEAVYVFPLPDDAAVNDFVMTVGSRSIRGVIREREQAERIYAQARAQGHTASLMTQERANIFTQRVANIEPGQPIDVAITYFGTLGFRDGAYEFVFPMVVGPRYNPPSAQGTGVGAVPAGAYAASGQAVEQQYLRPGERPGHDVSLSVDIAAGVRIESLESPTHRVLVSAPAPDRARVELAPSDSIPNRDFVLRCRVAGGEVKGGVLTHADASGGYLAMVLVPPSDLRYTARGPVEMIFVVDCSGSMSGEPLELAKAAVRTALAALRPGDTFQIIRFADTAEFLTRAPVRATPESIAEADRRVAALTPGGGTEMLRGLEPALEARTDGRRTRVVCLLSDGLLGNEPEVLKSLRSRLGDARVFTVAIGSAPNRALMNAMARLGRGAAAAVSTRRDAADAMNLFMDRVSAAAMTDLAIDWNGLDVTDVQPARLPDLYVGRPVLVTARFRGLPPVPAGIANSVVRVSGRVGSERQTVDVPVLGDPGDEADRALPLVWARTKITDLDEDAGWFSLPGAGSTRGANRSAIRDLALQYGLLSAYTAFVAVDASSRTPGAYGTTVQVPVAVPQGVRYETTVPER